MVVLPIYFPSMNPSGAPHASAQIVGVQFSRYEARLCRDRWVNKFLFQLRPASSPPRRLCSSLIFLITSETLIPLIASILIRLIHLISAPFHHTIRNVIHNTPDSCQIMPLPCVMRSSFKLFDHSLPSIALPVLNNLASSPKPTTSPDRP